MLEERQDRFIEEILSIYRRNKKSDSVNSELIDQIKSLSQYVKKEQLKATSKLSRQQVAAIRQFALHGSASTIAPRKRLRVLATSDFE